MRLPADASAFGWHVLRFCLPVLLVLALLEGVLWRTGEAYPAAWVIDVQHRAPGTVYLRGLMDQQFGAYKHQMLVRQRPRVVALGTSRVMQFTGAMFGPQERFTNLGGGIQTVSELEVLVQSLGRDETPSVVILGIEPWWFNAHVSDSDSFTPQLHQEGVLDAIIDWRGQLSAIRKLVRDPKLVTRVFGEKAHSDTLGIAARTSGSGFRADGSYEYADGPESDWHFVDRENPPVHERISQGTRQFPPTAGGDPERFATLHRALSALVGRGVLVIGFLPPMSSQSLQLMESRQGQARLWQEYRERVAAQFAEIGMPFVDATSLATLGLDDRYMRDGMHPMQTFHLHLLRKMMSDSRVAAALPACRSVIDAALADERTTPWEPAYPNAGSP